MQTQPGIAYLLEQAGQALEASHAEINRLTAENEALRQALAEAQDGTEDER